MSTNPILTALNDPEEIERIYQNNKREFHLWLNDAVDEKPDSEILRAWNARLNYRHVQENHQSKLSIPYTIALCLLSGMLVKLPEFLPIDSGWYYSRFSPLIIIGALLACFFQQIEKKQIKVRLVAGLSLCLLILFLLPDQPKSASITMALIHMPMVLVSFLAVGFMGEKWSSAESRLSYIHYLGEMLIYSSVILLGGVVLTFITLHIFELIEFPIYDFYFKYIVVLGLVSSPVVATYLYDNVFNRSSRLATLLSNIFSPLFLIAVSAGLLVVLYQGKTPYSDREFLITLNGLLLVVWGITVFSISGIRSSHTKKISGMINMSLLSVTLIINAIALSAIVFRLSEYGITPNRVVVTGENVLIFIHLILILKAYAAYMKEGKAVSQLTTTVANYLPIYSMWSLFVVVVLPLVFWFE